MIAVLDGTALGRWVEIALPDAPWGRPVPFVGYVYMDWEAGMSAKGGPADRPDDPPSLTVRLPIGAPRRRWVIRGSLSAMRRASARVRPFFWRTARNGSGCFTSDPGGCFRGRLVCRFR